MSEKLLKLAISTLSVITLGNGHCSAAIPSNITTVQNTLITTPQIAENPIEIARKITVRIITNSGGGSGVLIGKYGNTYTILTNNHVVLSIGNSKYTILTADGISHQGQLIKSPQFKNLDLAIIQFDSSYNYRIAEIAQSDNLLLGEAVYAAGFPNWYWVDRRTPISTANWGLKALKVTTGTLKMVLPNPLVFGYQIGYTNNVENGMSGGPVINAQGYLIGINGRLKYPFKGISSYKFVDQSMPSQQQFLQMQALSWAIPITAFKQVISINN